MRVTHSRTSKPAPGASRADPRVAQVIEWGARIAARGLSPGESGNMSLRADEGFLITRTGAPLGELETDDLVLVTGIERATNGGVIVKSVGGNDPSRDSAVHSAVYHARPEATAVFHFHVGNLDVLSSLGVPATRKWHSAGTTESMEEIEHFLRTGLAADYFVLVEHGIVAFGETVDAAGQLVEMHHQMVERALSA